MFPSGKPSQILLSDQKLLLELGVLAVQSRFQGVISDQNANRKNSESKFPPCNTTARREFDSRLFYKQVARGILWIKNVRNLQLAFTFTTLAML